jgi:nicotinate-nucleotide pyrophosphorylase (carboxylating)
VTPDPLAHRAKLTLDPAFVRAEIARFLAEDVGAGDVTTSAVVPPSASTRGRIVAREACVVAGLDLAREVFAQLDASLVFSPLIADGDAVPAGRTLVELAGPAAAMLTGERVALNVLQRLSGIATITRRYVDAIAGTGATVSDTRKTTPGLRIFEKYAVQAGGGRNHRVGLFDAVLVKDNHIVAAGGLDAALGALARTPPGMPVQVEVDSLEQLGRVVANGVRAVLLDNMAPAVVAEAVRVVRAAPDGAGCWIEASGGVTLATVRAYADAGVDTISVGAFTHSAPSVDLAIDVDPDRGAALSLLRNAGVSQG